MNQSIFNARPNLACDSHTQDLLALLQDRGFIHQCTDQAGWLRYSQESP